MITNQTTDFITFYVQQEGMADYSSPTIPPFQSGTFWWNCGGLDGSASVAILNNWEVWVAGFDIYQHEDDPPVVSGQWMHEEFQFAAPVCVPSGATTSCVQITVYTGASQ